MNINSNDLKDILAHALATIKEKMGESYSIESFLQNRWKEYWFWSDESWTDHNATRERKNTCKNIEVGDYTIYNDFVSNPCDFEKNNVLYHYPVNKDRLIIGKFCPIACGAKFMFTSGNHSMQSLSNYTFPIFFDEWELNPKDICEAWIIKGIRLYGMRYGWVGSLNDGTKKRKIV